MQVYDDAGAETSSGVVGGERGQGEGGQGEREIRGWGDLEMGGQGDVCIYISCRFYSTL